MQHVLALAQAVQMDNAKTVLVKIVHVAVVIVS
jgi:hypothetical protein